MMASRKELIFSSYRRLCRARLGLFRNDTHAMRESRVAVREQYLQHNSRGSGAVAAIPDDEFYNLLSMVDEAVDMMKHGIAQGNLNQNTGRYGRYK
jgi:complex III assembly factor LYRM7